MYHGLFHGGDAMEFIETVALWNGTVYWTVLASLSFSPTTRNASVCGYVRGSSQKTCCSLVPLGLHMSSPRRFLEVAQRERRVHNLL